MKEIGDANLKSTHPILKGYEKIILTFELLHVCMNLQIYPLWVFNLALCSLNRLKQLQTRMKSIVHFYIKYF